VKDIQAQAFYTVSRFLATGRDFFQGSLLWEHYNRVRARYVEEKALQYLGEALQHAQVYPNLTYQVSEGDEVKEVELGMVQK